MGILDTVGYLLIGVVCFVIFPILAIGTLHWIFDSGYGLVLLLIVAVIIVLGIGKIYDFGKSDGNTKKLHVKKRKRLCSECKRQYEDDIESWNQGYGPYHGTPQEPTCTH
ncbi:MAG: hypothetical protein OER82_00080 [Nitrosopumilus sp.]|nr:hypothetical protein [Nitrosopumilus sp.]